MALEDIDQRFFKAWMEKDYIEDIADELKNDYKNKETNKPKPEKNIVLALRHKRKKYEGKLGIVLPDRPSKNKRGRKVVLPTKKETMDYLKTLGLTQAKMNAIKKERNKTK